MTKQIILVSFIVAIALSTANCGITELHASSKGTSTQVAIPGLSKQVAPAYQNDTKTAASLPIAAITASDTIEKRDQVIFIKGANVAFTGTVERRAITGKLLLRYGVVSGLAHGAWVEWFEQGGVRFYSEWKAGKGDGVWIYFHENGEISERAQVLDDIWHGVAEGWYANGNKAFESTFVHGKRVVHQKFENQPEATP